MKRETVLKNGYLGERAIIVGGGVAGLSAARAVSDRFRQVVILDRDELPDGATPRPGVPQGKHPHGLFAGGLKAPDVRQLLKPLTVLDDPSIADRIKEEVAELSLSGLPR
jgi:flavin-dependent dehydrogenase